MSETPDEQEAPSGAFASIDAETTVRIREMAKVLGTSDQDVLTVALGLLEWYVSIDAAEGKQVMIVDLDSGTASLPHLSFERIDENGVMAMRLLPSERT